MTRYHTRIQPILSALAALSLVASGCNVSTVIERVSSDLVLDSPLVDCASSDALVSASWIDYSGGQREYRASWKLAEQGWESAQTLGTWSATTNSVFAVSKGEFIDVRVEARDADSNAVTSSNIEHVMACQVGSTNQPPIANSGADQNILVTSSVLTLNGSASTDSDGSIVSYSWVQKSGPSTLSIASPSAAVTNLSGFVVGTYSMQLIVTDNEGAVGFDLVQINVSESNLAPTARAGSDRVLNLPSSSVVLNGSASSDPDGTIVSYLWAAVTGVPAGASLSGTTTASLTMSNFPAGTYVLRLVVTDNDGATATDDVSVKVNQPPVAVIATQVAGPGSVTLHAWLSYDSDGTIPSTGILWQIVIGPAGAVIADPTAAIATMSNLGNGDYVVRLTVTDNDGGQGSNQVTILNANMPPVANAGADQDVALSQGSASLSASASSDPDGTITNYAWNIVSGPAGASLSPASSASPSTVLINVSTGTYVVQLTVTDNMGSTSTDLVTIRIGVLFPNATPFCSGSVKSVRLDWNPAPASFCPSNGILYTNVERKKQGGNFSQIAFVPSGATTYSDTSSDAALAVEYRVRAWCYSTGTFGEYETTKSFTQKSSCP